MRVQWKRLVVVGSAHLGAVFAWGTNHSLPAAIPRPIATFGQVWETICSSSCLQHMHYTKAVFTRIWAACVTHFSDAAGRTSSTLVSRCFGRNWTMQVLLADVIPAQLAIEQLLLDMPDSLEAMNTAWHALQDRFPLPTVRDIPPDVRFGAMTFTYDMAPAAFAPRHYSSDPVADIPCFASSSPLARHFCQLCGFHTPAESVWEKHLEDHGGPSSYRAQVLATEAQKWPAAVDPTVIRHCVSQYAQTFWERMSTATTFCGCCAMPSTFSAVQQHDLRSADFSLNELHELFSAQSYLTAHSALYPEFPPASFVGLPFDVLLQAGVPCPLPLASGFTDAWLLRLNTLALNEWTVAADNPEVPLHISLCSDCCGALRGSCQHELWRMETFVVLFRQSCTACLLLSASLLLAASHYGGCILCLVVQLHKIAKRLCLAMLFLFRKRLQAFCAICRDIHKKHQNCSRFSFRPIRLPILVPILRMWFDVIVFNWPWNGCNVTIHSMPICASTLRF